MVMHSGMGTMDSIMALKGHSTFKFIHGSTQNMIFSVTCYLELHNAIILYCASHF